MNTRKATAMLACLALSAGLAAGAGVTANAADVEWVDGLPTMIVNGDFEYPSVPDSWWRTWDGTKRYVTVTPSRAAAGYPGDDEEAVHAIDGFDAATFGWSSTQQAGTWWNGISYSAGNVELQREDDGNQFAEITADVGGTAIYEDIATIPGAVYVWEFKHASSSDRAVDSMGVMIGAPGAETAQRAERIASQAGNALGDVGETISTPADSPDYSRKLWDTYSGVYVVPEGQTVTRFTFQGATNQDVSGNCVDDIRFVVSYPLTYELNSGSGTIPNKE